MAHLKAIISIIIMTARTVECRKKSWGCKSSRAMRICHKVSSGTTTAIRAAITVAEAMDNPHEEVTDSILNAMMEATSITKKVTEVVTKGLAMEEVQSTTITVVDFKTGKEMRGTKGSRNKVEVVEIEAATTITEGTLKTLRVTSQTTTPKISGTSWTKTDHSPTRAAMVNLEATNLKTTMVKGTSSM
jgi:hypothetical protein